MKAARRWLCGALAVGVMCGLAWVAPASGSSFVRAGIPSLVERNDRVLLAQVLETESYWNSDGNFILTDVRLEVLDALKGEPATEPLTLTLMGGTVGELSTVILGGAQLAPGRSYLLFVDQADLPGAAGVRTVPAHAQGVFEIRAEGGRLRAFSQADPAMLVPDEAGLSLPPYGRTGVDLDELELEVRRLVAEQEVSP